MRQFLLGIALVIVGCSSGTMDPNKNPGPAQMNQEPPAKPAFAPIDYPTGPYGFMQGNTVQNLTFPALLPSSAKGDIGQVALGDLYDPDGARGINAIVVITSAEWCGVCQQEASQLESKIRSDYGTKGVVVVELMLEDTTMKRDMASVQAAADRWRTRFSLTDIAVGIDPSFTFAQGSSGTIGLPLNHVINPRDMTVALRQMGSGPQLDTTVSKLVAQNKLQ